MKEGWEYKKLGDVATFTRGLTYSKNDEAEISDNIVLRSNNVDLSTGKLNFDELKYLKPEFLIPEEKKVKKGSLLMCMSNGSKIHLGKVALINDDYPYAFGGFMALVTPNEELNPQFFNYSLSSPEYKDFIKKLSEGANINNIKVKELELFTIPVPPLSEQQSIVDYLDAAFAKIDTMKANVEKALNEAKALFQASLKEMLEPKDGWEEKKLGDVATFTRGLTYSKNDEAEISDNIVLRSNNVDLSTGKLNFDELKYLKPEFLIPEEKKVKKGSLLMCMSNGSKIHLGKVALINDDYPYAFGGFMALVTPNEELNPQFFNYSLSSPEYKDFIKKLSEGANINNIKVKELELFTITIPPLYEQQSIVETLDSLKSKVDRLQANYEKISQECDALKQAILRQVFE